jgi:homoserine kinase
MDRAEVRAFAPATIANLGSGYDVLGLAINRPGDVVDARRERERGLRFAVKTRHEGVPVDPKKNVAAYVAQLLVEESKPSFGIAITLRKRMPIGSGLGSSAASSVAALVAVNALLPRPLAKPDLLRFAVEGERLASGARHADNVAPSLLGGACIVRSYDPIDVVQVPVSNRLVWVVVHPHVVVRTEVARKILPKNVLLKKAVRQWGNVAGLVAGLASGDVSLVGRCVEDVIVEPVRARLVRGFHEVKASALAAGAFGCSFSGSGPSMFAVTDSLAAARRVASAMMTTFRMYAHVECDVYLSRVNLAGATVTRRVSR